MAAMYACYHGPSGLKRIAQRIHALTRFVAQALAAGGYQVGQAAKAGNAGPHLEAYLPYFDTVRVDIGNKSMERILKNAETRRINFRVIDQRTLGISLDETTTEADALELLACFNGDKAPGSTPVPD
jgi:glycine dehydrogenase